MSTQHVSWGSIELLHNCVRTLGHLATQGQPLPTVEYRAKVKLHGTNCAVQITPDGVVAQSRTQLLTPEADYKGFATWAHVHRAYFAALQPDLVIFGEWCGPGIEKGMAISKVPTKRFVVFAIQTSERLVYEPADVRAQLPAADAPPELHVLSWEGTSITIDFSSRENLDEAALELNRRVADVEREDPWVKRELGISGLGEGLVLYPVTVNGAPARLDTAELAILMFKAKGEKHRSAGTKVAVSVDATIVASINEFVTLMLTEARLQQGLSTVCGGVRDPKLTGAFLAWVAADVQKESVAELEASGLTWPQVDKAVQTKARAWFREAVTP